MTTAGPQQVPPELGGQGLAPFPAATEVPLTACRFQEALCDFRLALAQLRDDAAIDYTQLGLRFKLQAWEVSLHRRCGSGGAGCCCPWRGEGSLRL